jgi:hypothetical protein
MDRLSNSVKGVIVNGVQSTLSASCAMGTIAIVNKCLIFVWEWIAQSSCNTTIGAFFGLNVAINNLKSFPSVISTNIAT